MLPAQVDTLAPYGRDANRLQGLADARREMRLVAFPRGRSSARVNDRERLKSTELHAGWMLEFHGGHTSRKYDLEATLGTLKQPFVPCAVELNNEPLGRRRWSFDRHTGVLSARFSVRVGRLAVRPCL